VSWSINNVYSIIIPKTVFISEKDKIGDLDSYYESARIFPQKVK